MTTEPESKFQPAQSESFRLFVAISLPAHVQEAIEQRQKALVNLLSSDQAHWTKAEQLHLTLRFLGKVDSRHLSLLQSRLRDACRSFHPMNMQALGLGFFPEKRFPRVLWVGLHDQTNQMSRLHNAVQNATNEFTSEPAKSEFSAHITLARIKHIGRPEAEQLREVRERFRGTVFGEWMAHDVKLMRSQLSSAGARHTVLASFALGGT